VFVHPVTATFDVLDCCFSGGMGAKALQVEPAVNSR